MQDANALYRDGVAALHEGRFAHAIELLEAFVRARPGSAQAYNDLGSALGALERFQEAAAAFRVAIRLDDGLVDAYFNLGLASQEVGRLEDAVDAYSRAVRAEPGLEEASVELARVLRSLERPQEAVAVMEAAAATCRETATLHFNRGVALRAAGRPGDAEAAFRRCTELDPELGLAHNNLGGLLRDRDELDEAVTVLQRAVELRPDLGETHMNLGVAELGRGEARSALVALDRGLELSPGDTRALALKAVAHRELGELEAARWMLDFDRFVHTVQLSAPAGFSSLDEFNRSLARHVLEHPTLVSEPDEHATRKGWHSGNLLVEPKGPMAGLESAIEGVVRDYMRAMTGQPDHPFLAAPPQRIELQAWGVVLGASGHQIPHNHPAAWLSGVYYAQVPRVVSESRDEHAGWLEFGRPHPKYPCSVEPEVRAFQPSEGLMVVFPAYFYHHTVPFESDETRISIAFDVFSQIGMSP